MAIVVDGTVLAGRNGAAGEIGYNLREPCDVGRPADERILLEDAVSGKALERAALGLVPERQQRGRRVRAGRRRPRAAAVLADFVAELAFHLVNLAIADRSGPHRRRRRAGARPGSRLEPGLRAALDAAVPFPPELVLADFPYDAPLLGALALSTAAAREILSQAAPA